MSTRRYSPSSALDEPDEKSPESLRLLVPRVTGAVVCGLEALLEGDEVFVCPKRGENGLATTANADSGSPRSSRRAALKAPSAELHAEKEQGKRVSLGGIFTEKAGRLHRCQKEVST